MASVILPNQPLYVRTPPLASHLQMQSLTQLYQPIISAGALGLYLTFAYLPTNQKGLSARLNHAQLLQQANIGLQQFDQWRKHLEAVGLLETYRDRESHSQYQHQTLIYEVKPALTPDQFFQSATLRHALYSHVGGDQMQLLINQFQYHSLPYERYDNISSEFQQVFNPSSIVDPEIERSLKMAKWVGQAENVNGTEASADLNIERLHAYIINQGISESEWTQALQQELIAIAQVYQLNEEDLSQLVHLAYNDQTGQVEVEKLMELANKRHYFQRNNQSDGVSQKQAEQEPKIDEQTIKQRKQEIANEYPDLTKGDIDTAVQCEVIDLEVYLSKLKEAKGGFVSSNELYYVRELSKKTTLNQALINFLMYYLLLIQERPNLYKRDLERTANEWQQANYQSVPEVIKQIRDQETIKEIKQKQNNYRNYPNKQKKRYQEPVPDWLTTDAHSTNPPQKPTKQANALDESEIRARLNQLIKKRGEN